MPKPCRRSQVTWSNSTKSEPERTIAPDMPSLTAAAAPIVPVAVLPPSTVKPRNVMWSLFSHEQAGREAARPGGPQLERAAGPDQGQVVATLDDEALVTAEPVARARPGTIRVLPSGRLAIQALSAGLTLVAHVALIVAGTVFAPAGVPAGRRRRGRVARGVQGIGPSSPFDAIRPAVAVGIGDLRIGAELLLVRVGETVLVRTFAAVADPVAVGVGLRRVCTGTKLERCPKPVVVGVLTVVADPVAVGVGPERVHPGDVLLDVDEAVVIGVLAPVEQAVAIGIGAIRIGPGIGHFPPIRERVMVGVGRGARGCRGEHGDGKHQDRGRHDQDTGVRMKFHNCPI